MYNPVNKIRSLPLFFDLVEIGEKERMGQMCEERKSRMFDKAILVVQIIFAAEEEVESFVVVSGSKTRIKSRVKIGKRINLCIICIRAWTRARLLFFLVVEFRSLYQA